MLITRSFPKLPLNRLEIYRTVTNHVHIFDSDRSHFFGLIKQMERHTTETQESYQKST